MTRGQTENKQASYKSCFTAIFAVFFFPLFVFWMTWKNTKLKPGLRITTLIIMGIFDIFLYGVLIWAIIASTGAPSLADMKSPTNQKILTVSGSNSYNNSDIKVYLNNEVAKEMKADGKGDFSTTLELKEGSNKIKASATNDKSKTKTSSEAEVIYDITPPDFSFDQPQSPTSSDKFTLKGKSEKNAQIIVYLADREVKKTKVEKDSFEVKDIALIEGENKFTVKAIDEADNYSQPKEITVVYNKPKEEAKKSESPSQTSTPQPATPTPTPEPKQSEKPKLTASYEVVQLWDIPNGGQGKRVVLPSDLYFEEGLYLVCDKIDQDVKNDRNAFVFGHKNRKSAEIQAQGQMSDDDIEYENKNFVLSYAKNGNTGYHQCTIYPNGVDVDFDSKVKKY